MATTQTVSEARTQPHYAIQFNLCTRSNEDNTAPVLDFIEDVDAFLTKQNLQDRADEVMTELNRLYRGFKTHQQKILAERSDLQRRIPELKENLKLIKALREKDQTKVRFMAADSVWADGIIDAPKDSSEPKVSLWLGAGVMMEYTYDDGQELLEKNIEKSEATVSRQTRELLFLKEQITTCEVTVSRFCNYELARKRRLRVQEEEKMKISS